MSINDEQGRMSEGETIRPGHEPFLAAGVRGYTVEHEGWIWVPLVRAERAGRGDVGRYLDSLPTRRAYVFPNVISAQLWMMLKRRGFCEASCAETGEPLMVRIPELP